MRQDGTGRAATSLKALAIYGFLVVTLVFFTGCTPITQQDPLLEDGLDVTTIFGANWHGRHFIFQTLESEMPDARIDHFLQIEGDSMVVSFHSSNPPFVPVVQGTTIHFGGHRFEVTQTPNQYNVDGQPQSLPANSLYIFSNGQYEGTYLPQ